MGVYSLIGWRIAITASNICGVVYWEDTSVFSGDVVITRGEPPLLSVYFTPFAPSPNRKLIDSVNAAHFDVSNQKHEE